MAVASGRLVLCPERRSEGKCTEQEYRAEWAGQGWASKWGTLSAFYYGSVRVAISMVSLRISFGSGAEVQVRDSHQGLWSEG